MTLVIEVERKHSSPVGSNVSGRLRDPSLARNPPDHLEAVNQMDIIVTNGRTCELAVLRLTTPFPSLGDGGGKKELWLD